MSYRRNLILFEEKYLIYSIVHIVCQIEPRGSRLLHLAAIRALIVIH